MTQDGIEVRRCRRGEVDRAAEVLARAFLDDPIYAWVFADRRRRARLLPRYMRGLPLRGYGASGAVRVAVADGSVVGVLVDCGPGADPGWVATARALPATVGSAGVTGAAGLVRLDRAVGTVRPAEPHRYLFHLGTDPDWSGRGVGSALLRAALADGDAEGVPTHLECGPGTVAYYERFGFAPTEPVPFGAVDLRGMLRRPVRGEEGGRGGS